ncbi:hypothetical protein [Clostridium cochlearium]|nr:hypothetical protein [Clostridium cochlearium]
MCRVDVFLDRALGRIKENLKKESRYKKRCVNRNKLYQKRIKQGRK